MSNESLPGNPYDHSWSLIEGGGYTREQGHQQATEFILDDLVTATRALAYEQRTANLIALHNEMFPADALGSADAWRQVAEQIITRLGLDEVQS